MARNMDLVGTTDVARRIGAASRKTIIGWWRRYPDEFPTPVGIINGDQPVWRWADIAAWLEQTGRTEYLDRWAS